MSSSDVTFDWGRFRPLGAALGLVLAGLLAFELIGIASVGWSPKLLWTGKFPNEWYDWRNNARLVAGAELARRENSTRGLGLMVGASTTHYAITAQSLDACDGMDLDWLVITSTRMSFTVMEENVFEPLAMTSSLAAPAVLALGIHPEMLVGANEPVPTLSEAWGAVAASARRHRVLEAASALARASFIIHIRGRVANLLERQVNGARLVALRALGQPLSAIFYPPLAPYDDHIPKAGDTTTSIPDDQIQRYVRSWNALGFADRTKYSSRGPEAEALRRMLARYPGVPVVFLFLPVRSEFRDAKTLAPIRQVWDTLFREFAATRRVTVADLSGQLLNNEFKDVGHANIFGRRRLQKLVPRVIGLAAQGESGSGAACEIDAREPMGVRRVAP